MSLSASQLTRVKALVDEVSMMKELRSNAAKSDDWALYDRIDATIKRRANDRLDELCIAVTVLLDDVEAGQ